MTTTPLATIADALIEFILSLLRDPGAVEDFIEDPEESLAQAGLSNVCAEDVRAVLPVVVEHPHVSPRPPEPHPPVAPPVAHPVAPPPVTPPGPPNVVKEIITVANNFHIDSRSTIVDQSVNQNIWAEGDVTQIFDQEAVLATGDQSVAVGEDALIDSSETDIAAGDIAIGNTETTTEITDSFNDESVSVEAGLESEADGSFNDVSTDISVDTEIEDSFQNETATVVTTEAETSALVDTDDFQAEPSNEIPVETDLDEPDYVDAPADAAEESPLEMELEET